MIHRFVQDVFFLNKTAYDAQQTAYNKTIQHTVADVVDGVIPERVTDIVVEEEEEESGDRSSVRNGAVFRADASRPITLKYTVTVYDPLYTVAMLRATLVQAAQEGRMDTALRFYAAQFGATGLNNATLAVPQVTSAVEEDSDSFAVLNSWQIAVVVIGGVLALCVIVASVWCKRGKAKYSIVLPVVQHSEEEE